MHEYFHYLHSKSIGVEAYARLPSLAREQAAFDFIRRSPLWNALSRQEQDHAVLYVLKLGGDPTRAPTALEVSLP